jgi:hypothetical protein
MDFAQLAQRVLDLVAQREISRTMAADEHVRTSLGPFFAFPTRAQLAVVLREAFFATLLADEGRPTKFVLSLLPDTVLSDTASGQLDLAPPQPVTRASIRRLAPTAPPESALLRLKLTDGGADIVSIMTFAQHFGRPVSLSVAGHRPGVLSVSFNNQKVLHLQGDDLIALDGAVAHLDADYATTRLALHQQDGSYQGRQFMAQLVWQAVVKMKRAGHGGAFWFIRSAWAHQFEGEVQHQVAGTGDLFLPHTQALERGPEAFPDARQMAAENNLRWAEDDCISATLSQLAATDGAVLLSMEPKIIGFGAFVHTQPPDVRRRRNGIAETVAAHALGGGRHRSAAAFCNGGDPGHRAALIVSQDGAATMFFNVARDDAGGLGVLGAVAPGVFAARVEQVGRGFAADE